jgi:hypothetical protein
MFYGFLDSKALNDQARGKSRALSIKCAIRGNNNREIKSTNAEDQNISDKKILELYCNSESFFSKAYNSILNQYFPQKPLRDMLRYQLTGIRNAFRELNLLNFVTREESVEVPGFSRWR